MPSQLELAAARFRRELLNNERAAASAMVRMYGEAWRRTSQRAADVQAQIRAARLTGQPISPAWFYQQDRAETLQAQIEAELRRFAAYAEESTTALQRQAVTAAGGHAAGLVDLAAGVRPAGLEVPFDVLPTAALQDLVGFAADGSPLRDVFGEIAGVAERVTDTLGASLAAGLGPRETARLLRRQFGVGLARALTISRTETLRAYREAMHRNYEANDDVVEGWVWHATLTPRTCAACWAMHGTVHRLDERMDEHPNGRCTAVPVLKPWRELGLDIPDRRPVVVSGEDEFAKLTPAEQERVLGKAAYEAWRAGAVKLGDFAGHKHDAEWGDTLRRRSLRDMVGRDAAARWVEKARLIALGEWRPARKDAALVGRVGDAVWAALRERTRVRQVYVVPETWAHIHDKHGKEIVVELAREKLVSALINPIVVYQSPTQTQALVFVDKYDERFSMLAVVKVLDSEMWLSTIFKRPTNYAMKAAEKRRIVYRRGEGKGAWTDKG